MRRACPTKTRSPALEDARVGGPANPRLELPLRQCLAFGERRAARDAKRIVSSRRVRAATSFAVRRRKARRKAARAKRQNRLNARVRQQRSQRTAKRSMKPGALLVLEHFAHVDPDGKDNLADGELGAGSSSFKQHASRRRSCLRCAARPSTRAQLRTGRRGHPNRRATPPDGARFLGTLALSNDLLWIARASCSPARVRPRLTRVRADGR